MISFIDNSIRRVDYGHEEVKVNFGKDPRQYSTTTKEFLDDGKGNLCGVNTVGVEWTKSPTGQWQMKEVAGSEKHYPAQLILLAMGFLGPEKTVPTEIGNVGILGSVEYFHNVHNLNFSGLPLDGRGNIVTSTGPYGTSNPKVFAAGDCRRGQSLVVWAISEGRQAARQIGNLNKILLMLLFFFKRPSFTSRHILDRKTEHTARTWRCHRSQSNKLSGSSDSKKKSINILMSSIQQVNGIFLLMSSCIFN